MPSVSAKRPCNKVNSYYFPSNVLEKILQPQPVEDLVRWRCVSKHWLSVIDHPHFVTLHRIESYRREGGVKFLLGREVVVNYKHRELEYKLLDLPELEQDRLAPRVQNQTMKLPRMNGSLKDGSQGVEGLLCDGDMVWNPTTRKMFHLPQSESAAEAWSLGFDSRAAEYKVVQILSDKKVRVLTVGTDNAWRSIDSAHLPAKVHIYSIGHGVCAQNKIFFEVVDRFESLLVGIWVFLVGEERFQFLPPPQGMDRSKTNWSINECGNGSIALLTNVSNRPRYEVWILCDFEDQKWDCVNLYLGYDGNSYLGLITTKVICSIDNTDEVLVMTTCLKTIDTLGYGCETPKLYVWYSYWDVKKWTVRKGPRHGAQIYSKHVETLFDPTPRSKEIFGWEDDVGLSSHSNHDML